MKPQAVSENAALSKLNAINSCKMKYTVETSKIVTMLINACGWESFLDKQEIHHHDLVGAICNNIDSLNATLECIRKDYPELDTRVLEVVNEICVFKDNTNSSSIMSLEHTSLNASLIRAKLPYEEILKCINKIIINICGFMIIKVDNYYNLMPIFE